MMAVTLSTRRTADRSATSCGCPIRAGCPDEVLGEYRCNHFVVRLGDGLWFRVRRTGPGCSPARGAFGIAAVRWYR